MGQRTASGPARATERERDLTSDPSPALAASRTRGPRTIPEAAHALRQAGRLASGRRARLADAKHDDGSRPKTQIRTLSAREPTASLPAVRHSSEPWNSTRMPAPSLCRRDTPVTATPRTLEGEAIHTVQRAVRRRELRKIVPLADTTIYEMERRGDFPRRFYLTSKCVVWDLAEVERWLTDRRIASAAGEVRRPPDPNVRQRKRRPVRRESSAR